MTIGELIDRVRAYHPAAPVDLIQKAYDFSAEKHHGQRRLSGEPYLTHPLQVAGIIADLRLDVPSVATGLLHDTVEDTLATLEQIEQTFGPEIAALVDGVTKIGQINFRSREEKQAENFRKMLLAMARDLRVILIKLADRTHNMRTLGHLPPERQVEIAQETLDIYAPLAHRLGVNWIKSDLEDNALRFLHPEVYYQLKRSVAKKKAEREKYIKEVISVLTKRLTEAEIEAEVSGRPKHFYSIYEKMQAQNLLYDQIYDLVAFRIVVDTVGECYEGLGVVHANWKPVPGRFKDYIALPKANGYQSLHTTVIGPYGERIEIQIRTREMHRVAEYGIAAHWRYKEQRGGKRDTKYEQKIAWLRRLMDWRNEVETAQDFVESLKSDVFEEHIYVFTPQGDIVEMPKGATAIDFAYRIHTDLGHQCGGAKVNDRIIPLDTPLESGAVIKIIKDKNRVGPSRDWLQSDRFLKTANARSKVRQYFRRQRREENIAQGRAILDQTLKHLGMVHLAHADVFAYFPRYAALDDFLEAIGNTDVSPQNISSKIGEHRPDELLLDTESNAGSAPAGRPRTATSKGSS